MSDIRDLFEGDVTKRNAYAKTKTVCILNGAVSPLLKNELIAILQSKPFSVCVDGSSKTDLNPVTVRIFDTNTGKVVMRLLDMYHKL